MHCERISIDRKGRCSQPVDVAVANDRTNNTSTYAGDGVILTSSKQAISAGLASGVVRTLASTSSSSVLKVGSRGTAVTQLQKNLTKLGYDTKGTDGIFGNDTKNAVLSFQRAHKLTADGIVGAGTQSAIAKALNYVLDNYSYNAGKKELLQLSINNRQCYAGAMIEGFGEIGDVAEITLDDGTKFNFLILDTKSRNHTSDELQANSNSSTPQCQNQYGHGYMLNEGKTVQLSVCEFIVSESNGAGSATKYSNGEFLKSRHVTQAKIIGHVAIDENI